MKYIVLLMALIAFNVWALTPEAEKGKGSIPVCLSCHNADLNPPLAPPFYGVQNRYMMKYNNKSDFIKAIVKWVKMPTIDNALMQRPVKKLGLMPAMPMPDDMLKTIAAYLYEEEFLPPCTHWANEIKNSESMQNKGKNASRNKGPKGNNHDAMIRKKYNQLCY